MKDTVQWTAVYSRVKKYSKFLSPWHQIKEIRYTCLSACFGSCPSELKNTDQSRPHVRMRCFQRPGSGVSLRRILHTVAINQGAAHPCVNSHSLIHIGDTYGYLVNESIMGDPGEASYMKRESPHCHIVIFSLSKGRWHS